MAEGLLGGIFGEEGGRESDASVEAVAGAEAFAASLAADHAKDDPGVARAAERFLHEQAELLREQAAQLRIERPIRLSHLHGQSREGKLRRAGQSIRLGMQVVVTAFASVIGLGLVLMVHDAFTARSVVVDAFDAPASLAGRGWTGTVVASAVLDGLQKLQAATRSSTAGLSSVGAWASDIKIEVPETGVSIGEIGRLLDERFGHDVHVDGDLTQTDGGIELTVRAEGAPAESFKGGVGDLRVLASRAAEYVYGRSQPDQYLAYLSSVGRDADALAFVPSAFGRATSDEDRAELANEWGNAYADLNENAQAAGKYRLAMSLEAHDWKAWSNLIGSEFLLGGEEAAWRESRAFLGAVASMPPASRPRLNALANPAVATWDLPLAFAAERDDATLNGGAGTGGAIDGPFLADFSALLHDPDGAARAMAASDPDASATKAEALLLRAYALLDGGDGKAVAPMEAYWTLWQADSNLQSGAFDTPCYLGLAYGLAGRMDDARTIFRRFGSWSRCVAFEGDVLARAGDRDGAEQIWDKGLRIGPDLPIIYLHRGLFEAAQGDRRRAGLDFAAAYARAPHFADPLKAWGDLLLAGGQPAPALAKYDEALRYAPAWDELLRSRAVALRATPRD